MSGSTSRRKGDEAERQVVKALVRAGWRAMTSRFALEGRRTGRDVITDFPMAVEVKNQKVLDLAGWWKQAKDQANGDLPVVIHKRRGFAEAEDWWVLMDLRTLLDLVGPPRDYGTDVE